MKQLTKFIGIVVLGCFAVAANAKPVSLSFKTVPVTENSAELSRIEIAGHSLTAGVEDATQLKIMGASASQIFGADSAAGSSLQSATSSSRARPVLVTQAMTMPAAISRAAPADLSAQSATNAATGPGTFAAPDNNVLPVSEPPVFLLLALGMLLAGVRRKT